MEQRIAQAVVLAANQVHRLLGPTLAISIYQERLCHELALRKIPFVQWRPILVAYQGQQIDCNTRKLELELRL